MPEVYWTCDECRRVYKTTEKHVIDVETATYYISSFGTERIPYREIEKRTVCTPCLRTIYGRQSQ